MVEIKKYNCDVCKKPIKKGHQELYMATITIDGTSYDPNDSTESWSEKYHVHNDMSNHCLRGLLKILEGSEKKQNKGRNKK